jgi:hypothetical protein
MYSDEAIQDKVQETLRVIGDLRDCTISQEEFYIPPQDKNEVFLTLHSFNPFDNKILKDVKVMASSIGSLVLITNLPINLWISLSGLLNGFFGLGSTMHGTHNEQEMPRMISITYKDLAKNDDAHLMRVGLTKLFIQKRQNELPGSDPLTLKQSIEDINEKFKQVVDQENNTKKLLEVIINAASNTTATKRPTADIWHARFKDSIGKLDMMSKLSIKSNETYDAVIIKGSFIGQQREDLCRALDHCLNPATYLSDIKDKSDAPITISYQDLQKDPENINSCIEKLRSSYTAQQQDNPDTELTGPILQKANKEQQANDVIKG